MSSAQEKAKAVKLLALDVDGVLSDGGLHYSSGADGEFRESKTFFTADGLGIKMLQQAGIQVAIITGRQSALVARRAEELSIAHLIQGRDDKLSALEELLPRLGITLQEVAYMGDDLPDVAAIKACGLGMSVADGNEYVAEQADWRSGRGGGRGAVREACEFILQAQGKLAPIRAAWHSENKGGAT